MRRTLMIGCIAALLFALLATACETKSEMADERQWLAERTRNFLGVYKVAYDKVYELQGGEHPCTRGHKAEPAAVFHATLFMLNKAYGEYQSDVVKKLGDKLKSDTPMRDMFSVVERIAKPFAERSHVEQCGKMKSGEATEQFYLQTPLEAQQAVSQLKERMNEQSQG